LLANSGKIVGILSLVNSNPLAIGQSTVNPGLVREDIKCLLLNSLILAFSTPFNAIIKVFLGIFDLPRPLGTEILYILKGPLNC